jgi:plastocyanin
MNWPRLVIPFLTLSIWAVAGDVSGHAVITKRLTKKAIAPAVYSLRGTAPTVAPEGGVENEFDRMVVMLEGGAARPGAPLTAVMDQHNARFEPDMLVIPVGSSVQFPNSDPIFHNVFSLSKAESFDLGYYPRGKSRTIKFEHSGVVQVYCHLHASMYAAIVVTSSSWYGKPAADGSFSFANVPAGHYRVMAWHKVAGLHQTEIDVPQSGMTEVTLHIPFDAEPRK